MVLITSPDVEYILRINMGTFSYKLLNLVNWNNNFSPWSSVWFVYFTLILKICQMDCRQQFDRYPCCWCIGVILASLNFLKLITVLSSDKNHNLLFQVLRVIACRIKTIHYRVYGWTKWFVFSLCNYMEYTKNPWL